MSEPAAILAGIDTLRSRTRADRHAYAFPLFLFGVLILVAPLLYTPAADPDYSSDGWDPRVEGSNLLVRIFRTTAGNDPAHPTLIAWYWLLVLVGGFGATAWWYRRRAARVGVETDTRAFLVAAGAGFAGFFLGTFAFSHVALSLYGAWQVNLSIMFGSAVLAALAVWWGVRWQATRVVAVFVASVCGAVAFSSIGVYTNKGFSALLVIAGGLLALAWLERSVLLGVVAVLFTLASVPATAMIVNPTVYLDPAYLFWQLGWQADYVDTQLYALQQLIFPTAILLVGGAVAALTRGRAETTG